MAFGPSKRRLSTYLRNNSEDDKTVGRDERNCLSAINTGRPDKMGEI